MYLLPNWITKNFHSIGLGMEKQEMEMKWKLKMQPLSCCSLTKILILLAFVPRHARALPTSSF